MVSHLLSRRKVGGTCPNPDSQLSRYVQDYQDTQHHVFQGAWDVRHILSCEEVGGTGPIFFQTVWSGRQNQSYEEVGGT